jgi:hypothetical protein
MPPGGTSKNGSDVCPFCNVSEYFPKYPSSIPSTSGKLHAVFGGGVKPSVLAKRYHYPQGVFNEKNPRQKSRLEADMGLMYTRDR